MHSHLVYHNKNHDPFCHMFWMLKQNEYCEMLNNERGICMFKVSTNKCYNELFKSIEQILNVIFRYKPKRNAKLQYASKIIYCLLYPHLLYLFPNFWNLIRKNLMWLSSLTQPFLWKKSNILIWILQNLMIYHTKNLCHHINHI